MFHAQRPPAMEERRLSLHAGLRTFLHAERATYPVEQASMCAFAQFSKVKRAPSLLFPDQYETGYAYHDQLFASSSLPNSFFPWHSDALL